MCPSYKCVNLYGGFSARDTELKGKRRQSRGGCSTWDWKLHFLQHLGAQRRGSGGGHGGISCCWQPYSRGTCGQGVSLGSTSGGPGVTWRKRHGRVPSPRAHGTARSCLRRGRAGRCRPQLRCPSLPSTIYSQARSAAPPAPLTAAAATTPGRWDGGKPLPKRGSRAASQGCGGWSSGVSSSQVCCKAPPAGSIPQEKRAASPLQSKPHPHPQTHFPVGIWGGWEAPTHPKPSCLPSWGQALEQAASLGWRSSAKEESTCFQAQGNWSTLSFRCL